VAAAPVGPSEVRTLWIGDLQYWMDDNYIYGCFASTGEVRAFGSTLYESAAARGSLRSVPIDVGFNAHVYGLLMSLAVNFNFFVSSMHYDYSNKYCTNMFVSSMEYGYSIRKYRTYSGFGSISSEFRFIRASCYM
jgi:hypothetical protein